MDYISDFDIRLEKEMYYAGETLQGNVILNTTENFKLRGKIIDRIQNKRNKSISIWKLKHNLIYNPFYIQKRLQRILSFVSKQKIHI